MALTTSSQSDNNNNTTRPSHLIVRSMTVEDKAEVTNLINKVFKREPLCAYHGMDEALGAIIAESAVVDPVSFVVEDTSIEGPNRLVAFRASAIHQGYEPFYQPEEGQPDVPANPVIAILDSLYRIWRDASPALKRDPKAKMMYFLALGVEEDYEGKGLAKDLLEASLNKAMEYKCYAVNVCASAYATQHLFANRFGFKEMGREHTSEFRWRNPNNGDAEEKPFENLHQPEFTIVFEKKLDY
ncbi:hypothetical protein BGZ76_003051 [Entomortierella beljakovae]|nr:hypothetical protein BGZ76_003051 [Entomortierella beljakovae]